MIKFADKGLLYLFFLYLYFKNKKINWCKWLVSGSKGEFFFWDFLTIEKSVSNAGYHNNRTIKYGDIWLLAWYIKIRIDPEIIEIRYEPLSPK